MSSIVEYMYIKKKGERIGVFNKIQNLPPTCLDITGLNSSPFGSWYWYKFPLNSITCISGSEIPWGAEHVLVHSETHALQWLQFQVMTFDLGPFIW